MATNKPAQAAIAASIGASKELPPVLGISVDANFGEMLEARSDLIEAYKESVDAIAKIEKRTHGATARYAAALNGVFDFKWFGYNGNVNLSLHPEAKPLETERKSFMEMLKAAGHSNPNQYWSRVRAEGSIQALQNGTNGFTMEERNEAMAEAAAKASEASEEKAKGANNPPRSPKLRILEDCGGVYKFLSKHEGLDEKEQRARVLIGEALEAIGVTLSSLIS